MGIAHNTLNTNFYNKQDSLFETSDVLSNDFKFYQNIFTVRAAFTFNITEQLRLIAGLQAEQTHTAFKYDKGLEDLFSIISGSGKILDPGKIVNFLSLFSFHFLEVFVFIYILLNFFLKFTDSFDDFVKDPL